MRSNQKFDRDNLIKTIASVVGPEHSVDLKNYDLIILVDIIKVCFTTINTVLALFKIRFPRG